MKGQLLQIASLGNPVLRKKAKPVNNVKAREIQKCIDDLLTTVMDVNGVGISAPQVYQSYRIFIVASHPNPRYPNAPLMKPTPIINPKILSHNKEIKKDWEACLSIPGLRGLIARYTEITVSYRDRKGEKVKRTFTDFIARIVQHEYDHLDGLLFTDRVESNRDLISDKEYFQLLQSRKLTKRL
ncbi:MAG TPA: peptide deformylase [Patescibacteria group bacterium]|nr:peptide deformylase [Patescibacteria group bacterium]